MKHKLIRTLVLLVLLLGAGSLLVLAAYSPNGRELVSLGYLEKTFLPDVVEAGTSLAGSHEDAVCLAVGFDDGEGQRAVFCENICAVADNKGYCAFGCEILIYLSKSISAFGDYQHRHTAADFKRGVLFQRLVF